MNSSCFQKRSGGAAPGPNSVLETHMDSKLPRYGREFGILWEDVGGPQISQAAKKVTC